MATPYHSFGLEFARSERHHLQIDCAWDDRSNFRKHATEIFSTRACHGRSHSRWASALRHVVAMRAQSLARNAPSAPTHL